MVAYQNDILQSPLLLNDQSMIFVQFEAHKIKKYHNRLQHVQSYFFVLVEEFTLNVAEGIAFGVEAGAIVIGKHPLYIVMRVFQELVVSKFLVQVLEVHVGPNAQFVFVEHIVGKCLLQDFIKSILIFVFGFYLFELDESVVLDENSFLLFSLDFLQTVHETVVDPLIFAFTFQGDHVDCREHLKYRNQHIALVLFTRVVKQLQVGVGLLLPNFSLLLLFSVTSKFVLLFFQQLPPKHKLQVMFLQVLSNCFLGRRQLRFRIRELFNIIAYSSENPGTHNPRPIVLEVGWFQKFGL